MAASSHDRKALFGRLFNYANNGITIAGIVLTTLSALLIVTFMIVELSGGLKHNPYMGLFAYVALPGIFVIGLIEIPIGMWRRRGKLIRQGATEKELSSYPRLDFNDPRLRRIGTLVLGLTVVNAVILGSTSFMAVEKMESVEFCGETCHTVMQPENTAYQNSPHSRVACVECHIGPGASWFVRSKIDGLRQVWHTALGDYSRPIHTPLKNLRPARETCEHCHWPTKHHGDKLRTFNRYDTDEGNTPNYTTLLLKTGGGRLSTGQYGGIHWWHIYSDNKIRFVTGDERKEEILWVELTMPSGEVRTYTREGEEIPDQDSLEKQPRVMDCMDCHNRPAHQYPSPMLSVDQALEDGQISRDIPYVKVQAVQALAARYDTVDEAVVGIANSMREYYQEEYPEIIDKRSAELTTSIRRVQEIYRQSIFPEMKADWSAYPDNIGHLNSPGCFRCHTESMQAENGQSIFTSCNKCHLILAQGETVDDVNVNLDEGLAFVHPEDFDTLEEFTLCS
ncbi:MAG: NapC/NirT family cytochrome c, partial [Acidobacteria bacterium]|nr:NapC/NirT family cytochrome c [Acidobacteriota bacterium]